MLLSVRPHCFSKRVPNSLTGSFFFEFIDNFFQKFTEKLSCLEREALASLDIVFGEPSLHQSIFPPLKRAKWKIWNIIGNSDKKCSF